MKPSKKFKKKLLTFMLTRALKAKRGETPCLNTLIVFILQKKRVQTMQ